MRERGYSFLGRYDILDRATHQEGWDWFISDVFKHFGAGVNDVLSMGCSVGINEVLLGIKNPRTKVIGIDVDPVSIEIARSGVWNLNHIRPSGMTIPADDETLKILYDEFCPPGYFDLDFKKGILKLIKPVSNVAFEVKDATQTRYSPNSFDLIMMYVLAGGDCCPYSPTYKKLGWEVERIIKPEGLFWKEEGFFRVRRTKEDIAPYYRIVHCGQSYKLENIPTAREKLFPSRD